MNCETIIKTCKICIMKIPEEKKETEEGIWNNTDWEIYRLS
jgi:hypothetical protein